MWNRCKPAARWGVFVGMLAAIWTLLFFLSCPWVSYPNGSGWVSVHGSWELVKAVQKEYDDTHHGIGHTIEGLDYLRWRINQYSPSTLTFRIPYGVILIPLSLILICSILPALFMVLVWRVPSRSTNLTPVSAIAIHP